MSDANLSKQQQDEEQWWEEMMKSYVPPKIPYPQDEVYHCIVVKQEDLFEKMQHLLGDDVYLEYSAQVKFSNHYDDFEFEIIDNELIIYDTRTHVKWFPIDDFKIYLNRIRKIWINNFGELIFELNEYNEYIKIGKSYKQDMSC